jgi:hypothetical protein
MPFMEGQKKEPDFCPALYYIIISHFRVPFYAMFYGEIIRQSKGATTATTATPFFHNTLNMPISYISLYQYSLILLIFYFIVAVVAYRVQKAL